MNIFFQSSIRSYCRRVVSMNTPDTFVDNVLLGKSTENSLPALIKAAKRSYPNEVQNYLGNLLSKSETSVVNKVKIASILGIFNTDFSTRILGDALNGLEVNAGDQFNNHMTSAVSVDSAGSVSDRTLGDLVAIPLREKKPDVIKAIIDALYQNKTAASVIHLKKYAEVKSRPFSMLAIEKANEIEEGLNGCCFPPLGYLMRLYS